MAKKKLKPVELFDSIHTMWLHNWEQFNLSKKAHWFYVNDKDRVAKRKVSDQRFKEAFFKVHDEYSKASGGEELLGEYKDLVLLKMEAVEEWVSGDLSQETKVQEIQERINGLMGAKNSDPIKTRAAYSRQYGMKINPKETTIAEYLAIIELVQEQPNDEGNQG